jgi:RNA polymerase sigma-70 factor (ECF subfamily)
MAAGPQRSFPLPDAEERGLIAAATLRPVGASGIDVNSSFRIDVPDTVLARAKRGELAAFEQIYRLFERPAWTLALRLSGDADNAREIVHDAMLRLLERIAQFRGESPFWGWVRQIVLNEALMRLRRERGRVFESIEEDFEPPADPAPPWALADACRLNEALDTLPALTRSVIWLYHVEGYTHPEIADLTGKSVSFSKSQLARGTARLRELLNPSKVESSCSIATPVAG